MTSSRTNLRLLALALAAALAGCDAPRDPGYQGWVEADMIFVSPDESGRVTKLSVREGDEVKAGQATLSPWTTTCSRPTSTRTRPRSPTRSKAMTAPPP